MSGYRQKAARSLLWTVLESGGLSGLSFLTLIVFSRFLSPSEFGIASMALGVVQLLQVPVELLFLDALVQKKDVTQRHFDTAFAGSILLGIGLCLLCWLGADLFADMTGNPQAAPVLRWMSLSLPPMGLGTVLIARQRRTMQFRPLALRSLAGRLAAAIVGVLLAMCGAGVWSLVAQQVLMVALSTLALWIAAGTRLHCRPHWPEFKELFGFGAATTAVMLVGMAVQRTFIVLVGSFLGAESAGYLSIAFRAVDTLRDLAAGAASQLSLSLFSRLRESGKDLRIALNNAVLFTCSLMFPIFAELAVIAPEAVEILFGRRWLVSAPYVALMALLTIPYFVRMYSWHLMNAVGRPQLPLAAMLAQLVFLVIAMATVGPVVASCRRRLGGAAAGQRTDRHDDAYARHRDRRPGADCGRAAGPAHSRPDGSGGLRAGVPLLVQANPWGSGSQPTS